MPPYTSCAPATSSETNTADSEDALLWQSCRAEAESMWEEIQRRLCPDLSRKAAFVDQMARNLLNKITRRQRGQILRRILGKSAIPHQQSA